MTGPVLISITESYLDALNHGVVPTISSSWQVSFKSTFNFYLSEIETC